MLSALLVVLSMVQARSGEAGEEIVFPNDPKALVDVKRDSVHLRGGDAHLLYNIIYPQGVNGVSPFKAE